MYFIYIVIQITIEWQDGAGDQHQSHPTTVEGGRDGFGGRGKGKQTGVNLKYKKTDKKKDSQYWQLAQRQLRSAILTTKQF